MLHFLLNTYIITNKFSLTILKLLQNKKKLWDVQFKADNFINNKSDIPRCSHSISNNELKFLILCYSPHLFIFPLFHLYFNVLFVSFYLINFLVLFPNVLFRFCISVKTWFPTQLIQRPLNVEINSSHSITEPGGSTIKIGSWIIYAKNNNTNKTNWTTNHKIRNWICN